MRQFAVIGLGNFGTYLAAELYQKGHEVLAIDRSSARVQDFKDSASRAVVADGADRRALEQLDIAEMDAVIVAVGSLVSQSILITLNVKELGVRKIYAKAISEPHGRILARVGASEVLFPEKDLALTLAEKLHNPNVLDWLKFSEEYSISQFAVPDSFIGKTLRDLDLPHKYGIQVVAVRNEAQEKPHTVPDADYAFRSGDTLILIGPNEGLAKLRDA
ncbi:potassium channel family protein [Kiritimatiella glycovorans]|uniref:Ktr system potassium uptake protein A n=1 Tax=Kiritimatiella glycovorans TaxID=1307763 RepID=A0A0G3EJP5_9BACT|nr:TrkA family potassium uptake protein [Kiritimatiella glycovorans]AKJ65015.1 Ktr system potassium uptake protein A [Kiritimatiella glycovorans]